MKRIGWREFGFLVGVYFIILIIQFIGGYFSMNSIQSWYYALEKAPWNPPNWVFGPAWTILYVLMTLAIWIVFLSNGNQRIKRICYSLFFLQLFVNFLWSIFFFSMQCPALAFLDIVVLTVLIVYNIFYYYKINKLAAWLMVPYLFWVLFAATLNFSIVILN